MSNRYPVPSRILLSILTLNITDAVGARKPSVIIIVINFVISDSDDDCGGVRFRPHFLLFFRLTTVTRHDRAGDTDFQSRFSVQRTFPEGRVGDVGSC